MLTAADALVQFPVLVLGGVFFFQVPGTLCRREREKASRATLVEVCRHAEWVFGLWKKHETRNITVTDERIWHRGVDGQLAKSIF
jgi:hypothetical protein